MNATDMLAKIGESVGSTATVKTIFGEPIHAQGKTIVPVARVLCGFGGGGGHKSSTHNGASAEPLEGGGGGGGVCAFPAGALEITQEYTRFVPMIDYRRMAAVFLAGMVFGRLILRRRR